MKILFTIHGLTAGGAERVTASVANGLNKLGHDIFILTNNVSNQDYPIDANIKIILRNLSCGGLGRILNYCKQLTSIINNNDIDIVISINGGWLPLTIGLCRLCGVKIVYSDHNSFERPDNAPMPKSVRKQKFTYSRFCNLTTVLTNRDKEVLNNRNNVVVAPNPLFLPLLKEIPPKEKIVLAVGRYDAWHVKGFDLLIKAWANLCKKYPDWKLRIVGMSSESAKTKMQGFITDYKASNVDLVPFRGDIELEYRNAEIFVLSSRFEGFGLVLTEAMSQRCACIACDYKTRQSDIITDGVDGLICKADSVSDLTEIMDQLIADGHLRESLKMHSIDNLSRYSERNISNMWNNFLSKLL